MMRTKDLTGDEFWIRCVFCGDSQRDTHKSHFSVNLKSGKYHCYRCGAGGVMPINILLRVVSEAGLDPFSIIGKDPALSLSDALEYLVPGPASSRVSALERFHLRNFREHDWDAFKMYDQKLNVVGVLLRAVSGEKASYVVGNRGLLVPKGSSVRGYPEYPLRVVEGPYDVLARNDVGIAGFLSRNKLADLLRGQFVMLCPDGDVWQKRDLMVMLATAVKGLSNAKFGPWPTTIEMLPDGLDPDEVPISKRTRIPVNEFLAGAVKRGLVLQLYLKEKRNYDKSFSY